MTQLILMLIPFTVFTLIFTVMSLIWYVRVRRNRPQGERDSNSDMTDLSR
jgi:hypothetical protein